MQLSDKAQKALPKHIAIIMDGNGRWATSRNLPRVEGHRRGAESVREIVTACGEIGIRYLTLYAFSQENWSRPASEVDALMKYLSHYLRTETRLLMKNNVRLETIGQIERLPQKVQSDLAQAKKTLSRNSGLTLILALSYGSRQELTQAVREICREAVSGRLDVESITEETISRHLDTEPYPDPELLIRTSGELRISNFLLWQISYAEFVVSPALWPDFDRSELVAALEQYAQRNRRFGGL
jgi:undecaprenyl diphosphate synthase